MQSVRMVNLVPAVTSSPLWTSMRCWKTSTRPALGSTSSQRFLLGVWKRVAPPASPSPPFRYRWIVRKLLSGGSEPSAAAAWACRPSQCGLKYWPGPYLRKRRRGLSLGVA